MVKNHSTFIFIISLLLFMVLSNQIHGRKIKFNRFFYDADRKILSGQYDKAISNYLRGFLLASGREQAEVWDDLGYAFLQKGEIDKAKSYLKESISVHSENYNPRFYLAMAYLLANDVNLASDQLEKIEGDIYFDDRWMEDTEGILFLKRNGKEVASEELEIIRREKSIYIEDKQKFEKIIHLDAFDERNEGAFYYAQGVCYKAKKKFKKAEQKILSALDADYDEIDVRSQLIELYLIQDQYGKAEQQLEVMLNREKENGTILFYQAILKAKRGQEAEAIALLEKSFSIDSTLIQSKDNIARIYFNQCKLEEALQIWEDLFKRFPDKIEIKRKIEQTSLLLKRTKKEIKKINLVCQLPRLLRIEAHHRLIKHQNDLLPEIHRLFFKELEKGNFNAATNILEKALLVDEQSFIVNHNLGLLYFDMAKIEHLDLEKLQKAEMYCGRALWFKDFHWVNKEHLIGCHDLMGNIYYQRKKSEKALREFKKIIELDPLNAQAHYNLGCVYADLDERYRLNAENEWKKAIECEKKILKKEEKISEDELKFFLTVLKKPVSFQAHVSLGYSYLEQDFIEDALKEFKKAIVIEPDHPEPYYELGKIYHTRSGLDEEYIEKAIFYYEKYLYLGGKREKKVRDLIKLLKQE